MVRKLVGAFTVLALCVGFVMADEIKGNITKIGDGKVTVVTGKKDDKKTTEYDLAKDVKYFKMDKKDKVALEGGAKNEVFQNIDKKGVAATLNVEKNTVTEIVVKGKKPAN
jgi:predicted nucleotide-binding protein (sugar kinase/HSP70/actin superfamily)